MRSSSRTDVWETSDETYSEAQVESVLDKLEVEIVGETHTHFQCLCPFHDNTDSPAFVVDKTQGLWVCFNPSCGLAGTLEEMVRKILECSPFKAQMTIINSQDDDPAPYERKKTLVPTELREFDQEKLDQLYKNFRGSPAQTYMYGRGFEDETLEHFKIGHAPEKSYPRYRPAMVTVPMHDIKGMPIGLIGRSLEGKSFKNSDGLPKKMTSWNIHRAKREGEAVIIVEASFDAMRVHQAGYPNVIALLGGHVSQYHLQQIDRSFTEVILMTDYESGDDLFAPTGCRKCNPNPCRGHRPGRDLARSIIKGLPNKRIKWAAYNDSCVYPHGAKDVGDMTDDEIRQCLKNAISNFQYSRWNVEEQGLLS